MRVVCVEIFAADVRHDVEGDELDSGSICSDDGRRRGPCEVVARQVRVPPRVDDERLLQPAQAVQHDESRRAARFQGLRHRHAHRLRTQVCSLHESLTASRFCGFLHLLSLLVPIIKTHLSHHHHCHTVHHFYSFPLKTQNVPTRNSSHHIDSPLSSDSFTDSGLLNGFLFSFHQPFSSVRA